MKELRVKNLIFKEGRPNICVPLTGRNEAEILIQAEQIRNCGCDLCEWRADCIEGQVSEETILHLLESIHTILDPVPLIFTFRTEKEGGNRDLCVDEYSSLLEKVIASKNADLVDIELFTGEPAVSRLISLAHQSGTAVILSSHDFEKTPDFSIMFSRLQEMKKLGADLPKLAVMPQSEEDVRALLSACREFTSSSDSPCIAISMSAQGSVSRIKGGLYGSVMTFASCVDSSAPGQIQIDELKKLMDDIYK